MGAVVGTALALTGAGGGILAVPLLMFGLQMTLVQAAPIGLLAVGIAAATGAFLGLRDGLVRYRAAAIIGTSGMLAAPVGVHLAHTLPNAPLTIGFSLVLAWVALRSWRQAGTSTSAGLQSTSDCRICQFDTTVGRLRLNSSCVATLVCTGALSGLLSGLLGVGGGFVIVPMMSWLSNVPASGVVATSLAVIALVSVGGVAGALAKGGVDWAIALPFAAGAMGALIAGRQLGKGIAATKLYRAFGVTAGAVALLLLLRGLGAWGSS